MDEQLLTSLADTQSTTTTVLPTLTDSTHPTCYDWGLLTDYRAVTAIVMTNDVAELHPASPPDAIS
jgi:hypothetical protein